MISIQMQNGFASENVRTVIVSTASPYKFAESVLKSLGVNLYRRMIMSRPCSLRVSGIRIPNAMKELHLSPIRHDKVCETDKMKANVEKY